MKNYLGFMLILISHAHVEHRESTTSFWAFEFNDYNFLSLRLCASLCWVLQVSILFAVIFVYCLKLAFVFICLFQIFLFCDQYFLIFFLLKFHESTSILFYFSINFNLLNSMSFNLISQALYLLSLRCNLFL